MHNVCMIMYVWLWRNFAMAYEIAICIIECIAKHKAWLRYLHFAKLNVFACEKGTIGMRVLFIICYVCLVMNGYECGMYLCLRVCSTLIRTPRYAFRVIDSIDDVSSA